ncbi:hypothetical protein [Noviherbaspirillum sp.]|uniref:hypothetical protein n=1 Tax=Noviherbaspirillum sp. TaxID=1926288 RepID=UPI002FE333C5
MSPEKQLDIIIRGKVTEAVNAHLDGDWSALQTLFTIPRAMFDAWADSIELPYGSVSNRISRTDGVYVLQDAEGWLVFEQRNGVHPKGERMYPDYRQAKRAALSLAYLSVLRGAV